MDTHTQTVLHTLWRRMNAGITDTRFCLRLLLREGCEPAFCLVDVMRLLFWRRAAIEWCGIEGVWKECLLTLFQQL
ncbi:hypothetical protein BCY84_06718 [Trypanosoma cruzi cruzi]|nr:hypothetical protein BCY84_06718 [Trypanosoma cruzi cruzi]